MSLPEAVLAIADQMEQDCKEYWEAGMMGHEEERLLKGYVKQLRIAVKASGGVQPPVAQQAFNPFALTDPTSATAQHHIQIERAREEMRRQKEGQGLLSSHQERAEPRMVLVIDGDMEGTAVPVANEAPLGCFVEFNGIVFTLTKEGLKTRD